MGEHRSNDEYGMQVEVSQERIDDLEASNECLICMETVYKQRWDCPQCTAVTCQKCFNQWMLRSRTCPQCRLIFAPTCTMICACVLYIVLQILMLGLAFIILFSLANQGMMSRTMAAFGWMACCIVWGFSITVYDEI